MALRVLYFPIMLRTLKNAAGKTRYYLPISAGLVSTFRFFLEAEKRPALAGRFRWSGMEFKSRWKDWVAVDEIIYDREYDFIAPLLAGRKSPLVLDLGANIGLFSLTVFRFAPDAEVHAVEASLLSDWQRHRVVFGPFALLPHGLAARVHLQHC